MSRNVAKLKVPGFSPNCLVGAIAAVAQHQLGLVGGLERLYFCHTFRYAKQAAILAAEGPIALLNASFTRELPVTKDAFADRLRRYHCLEVLHKGYWRFDELLDDLAELTAAGELPLTEIDFFHVRQHPYHHVLKEQHMMVVYGLDREHGHLAVCEAVYGHTRFPLDDYQAFFEEVTQALKRPFYLAVAKRTPGAAEKISLEDVLHDVDLSLANLTAPSPDRGITALQHFIDDLSAYLAEPRPPFRIYGLWVFMCDFMNNLRFVGELERDHPVLATQPWLGPLKRSLTTLNRKWFSVTTELDAAAARGDALAPPSVLPTLREILVEERACLEHLEALRASLPQLLSSPRERPPAVAPPPMKIPLPA